jgi:hypothetical protein
MQGTLLPGVLLWVGFAVLLLLCLPFAGTRKLVLEVSAFVVRVALIALLIGGAVLWFRPDLLPSQVLTVLNREPLLRDILPSPEAQTFGLAAAALVAAVLLPILAMLDVTRRLAGERMCRLIEMTDPPQIAPNPLPGAQPLEPPSVMTRTGEVAAPRQHRPDRRAAADTLAEASSRKPYRVADQSS